MPKFICLFLSIYCGISTLSAQDPHFSFFAANALGTNPALTGNINVNSSRVQLSNRRQWFSVLGSGDFATSFVGFDHRACVNRNLYLGIGGYFVYDERGDFPLRRSDAMMSLSLVKLLEEGHRYNTYLSAGMEGGLLSHRLGNGDLTFDEQFDDQTIPDEIDGTVGDNSVDFGAGIVLNMTANRAGFLDLQAGFAIKHLTKPGLDFFAVEDDLTPRLEHHFVYHFAATLFTNRSVMLPIQVIYRVQQPHRQVLAHIGGRLPVGKSDFQISTGLRMSKSYDGFRADAYILRVSSAFDNLRLTINYDGGLSALRNAAKQVGAIELLAAYRFGENDCKLVICP